MTNKEHIAAYKELERIGIFNVDINPVNWDATLPVTTDYLYIRKTFKDKADAFLKQTFIISPYSWRMNAINLRTKIIGRQNLKGIKGAIATCNHIFMFDCLAVRKALKWHKRKYVVAEFNNFQGFLGDMMRADGILPISKNYNVMKKFYNAVEHHLLHDNIVVVYPEESMWYMYDKVRPFGSAAFHMAVKNNVPIVPMFITLRGSGKYDAEGLEIQYFTVHIMAPIYIDSNKSFEENVKYLKETNYNMCVDKYEEIYGHKMEYDTLESI